MYHSKEAKKFGIPNMEYRRNSVKLLYSKLGGNLRNLLPKRRKSGKKEVKTSGGIPYRRNSAGTLVENCPKGRFIIYDLSAGSINKTTIPSKVRAGSVAVKSALEIAFFKKQDWGL